MWNCQIVHNLPNQKLSGHATRSLIWQLHLLWQQRPASGSSWLTPAVVSSKWNNFLNCWYNRAGLWNNDRIGKRRLLPTHAILHRRTVNDIGPIRWRNGPNKKWPRFIYEHSSRCPAEGDGHVNTWTCRNCRSLVFRWPRSLYNVYK